MRSHPVWVCGLKPSTGISNSGETLVTPCMGVWIETALHRYLYKMGQVTPCMGVWIETQGCRGSRAAAQVTPCMGVWIETCQK